MDGLVWDVAFREVDLEVGQSSTELHLPVHNLMAS